MFRDDFVWGVASSAYQVEKALVENDVREVLKSMEKMEIVESDH